MFDLVSTSLFGTADSAMASVSTPEFLMCCAASIVLGAACAAIYMFRHNYSKNFVVTLALLPLIVQMVITLVNGNLGAGIAVMGVFNLVRFRSIPGLCERHRQRVFGDGHWSSDRHGLHRPRDAVHHYCGHRERRVCAHAVWQTRRAGQTPVRIGARKVSNSTACSMTCWGVSQKAMSLLRFARRTWAAYISSNTRFVCASPVLRSA